MNVTHVTNACALYESDGIRLLADPWLTKGAFEGSWFHYPTLRSAPSDFSGVDALYISHLHPDHFDTEALKSFRPSIPIYVLDRAPNYLSRMLAKEGFTDIRRLKPGETGYLGPFRIHLYPPFARHPFDEASLGNVVDSAMLIEDGQHRVLNANDNTLTRDAALVFRSKEIDLAQLNFNAAGPYPACFEGYRTDTRELLSRMVLRRSLDHLVSLLSVMRPRFFQPFAGAFVIGGSMHRKNSYGGMTTSDEAARYVQAALPHQSVAVLDELDTLDLATGAVLRSASIRHASPEAVGRFNRHARYTYEDDATPDRRALLGLLPTARANLWRKQTELNLFPVCWFYLDLGDRYFEIPLHEESARFIPADESIAHAPQMPMLMAALDERLLWRILTGKAHWNNAEVGMHVSFLRVPDVHQPDVHTLLSFLHQPKEAAIPCA